MLASLSPRRRLFLGVLAGVLAAVLAVVVVLATSSNGSPSRQSGAGAPPDRPGPVVLVPGYGGSTDALEPLAARLRAAGRQAVVLALPDEGTGDLHAAAHALDSEVRRLEAAGAPSVDIVGYSAGGVTAHLWADEDGGASRARRVITLGSPHHGTQVAAEAAQLLGGCTVACLQLAPGSAFLTKLGSTATAGPAWLALWTAADDTVVPPDSGRLDGAVDVRLQDLCPGSRTSHAALPRDAAVQALVLAALSGPRLAPPAPGVCPS